MRPLSQNQRITILVDDDDFALKLARKQLALCGITNIVEFQDAQAALLKVREDPYAVGMIVSDIQMPGLDGVGFIAELGKVGYLGSLVLVTGEDTRVLQSVKELANGLRLQLLGTLRKPIQSSEMLKLLEGGAVQQPNLDARSVFNQHKLTAQELKRAINEYQLLNHYQPKVDMRSGAVIGFEALARWNHPSFGPIAPSLFIEIAEKNGLIQELTEQLLLGPRGSLSEVRHWHDRGYKIQLSINVSQFITKAGFADFFLRALDKQGLSPEMLCLELTETASAPNRLEALTEYARLSLNKVVLSADNFGTGFSSLSQLRKIPFKEMKLDPEFVTGSSTSRSKSAILKGCIRIAKDLGIATVAESIETREDWNHLSALECDFAQGNFIAQPMTGDEVIPWLNRWEVRRRSISESLFSRTTEGAMNSYV